MDNLKRFVTLGTFIDGLQGKLHVVLDSHKEIVTISTTESLYRGKNVVTNMKIPLDDFENLLNNIQSNYNASIPG